MMKITDLSKSNADLPKAVIPPQKPGQVKIWKPMTTENFN